MPLSMTILIIISLSGSHMAVSMLFFQTGRKRMQLNARRRDLNHAALGEISRNYVVTIFRLNWPVNILEEISLLFALSEDDRHFSSQRI
jgi:hypothetical protein